MLKFLLMVLVGALFVIFICCLFGINIKLFNNDFRFDTFFKRGTPRIDDKFGCWYITGKQGSNKSYYACYLISRINPIAVNKIYTNVHSLKVKGFDIVYFDKITELYENTDEHCIFLIDELSRKYDKNSRTDTQFYAWLNQSRKRKRIVIMITQEWRELPMWLRRPAKYMFSSVPTVLRFFNIYKCVVGDAENLVFNKDEGEYECPTIKKVYYKRIKRVANLYDTFEPINFL